MRKYFWQGLKVMPLDFWITSMFAEETLEDYTETTPIFNRDGMYYFCGDCWFEYQGKAWEYDKRQFLYDLSLKNAPIYRKAEYDALYLLEKAGILTAELKNKLEAYRNYMQTRNVYRNSRKLSILLKRRINDKYSNQAL